MIPISSVVCQEDVVPVSDINDDTDLSGSLNEWRDLGDRRGTLGNTRQAGASAMSP